MIKILFSFLFLLSFSLFSADAPNTKTLIDCENTLIDVSANGNNATLAGTASYQTSGAWHGSYSFSSSSGGRFTLPTAVLNTAGTMEASFRTAASPGNSKALWSCSAAAGNRAIEIYQYGGSFYAYGNGVGGTNTPFLSYSASTNYYIKDTWDGSGNRKIWVGIWTVAGTVTLTRYFNSTATSVASPTAVYFLDSAAGNLSDLSVDWVRFRNVYDDTSTVTLDISDSPSGPSTPYQFFRKENRITPRMGFFVPLVFLFPRNVFAVIQDGLAEQKKANKTQIEFQRKEFEKSSLSMTVTKTPLIDLSKFPTATPTITPSAKLTATPTITGKAFF